MSALFLIFWLAPGASRGATLDDAAQMVRNPAKVILISVARAGRRLVAVGAHGVIIVSDDDGRSWRQDAVPTAETITCVGFATPLDGWAAGGQGVVLHTSDGGITWRRQITGAQVLPLMQAAAAQFAAGDPANPLAMRAVRRADIFTQAGLDKPFLTILPLSAQAAIIFGAYRMTIITEDGGATWRDWSLHVGDPVSHNIYDVTLLAGAVFLAGEAGTVLRAKNPPASDFELVTAPADGTLLGVVGTARGALLSFGVAGEVYRSTDAGQNWSPAHLAAGADLTAGLAMASGEVVVASEDGALFASNDDGVSFHRLRVNEDMALFGMTQAGSGDVILVGSGGVRVVPGADID